MLDCSYYQSNDVVQLCFRDVFACHFSVMSLVTSAYKPNIFMQNMEDLTSVYFCLTETSLVTHILSK